jgi:hypothetical protein
MYRMNEYCQNADPSKCIISFNLTNTPLKEENKYLIIRKNDYN